MKLNSLARHLVALMLMALLLSACAPIDGAGEDNANVNESNNNSEVGVNSSELEKESNEYAITTSVRKSRRTWHYESYVLLNNAEIQDDLDLLRDERKIDAGTDDTGWDRFIKEASKKHHRKCQIRSHCL